MNPQYVTYRRRYDRKRSEGVCVRSGCHAVAVSGKSLCPDHRERANAYWKARKAQAVAP